MKILAPQIKKNPADLENEIDNSLGTTPGGGGNPAADVGTSVAGFNGILSSSDTNIQLAFDTLDDKCLDKNKFSPQDQSLPVSGPVTVDFATGFYHRLSITGNITGWTLSNPVIGESYRIEIIYTGSPTVAALAGVLWSDGIAPIFTSANTKRDIIDLLYDGTDYLGSVALNF